ncbi:MAG: PhzF family phenazine biosynthesis isomerase [Spirochaetes bacterium]|nr:PhzF family phenazine biosynthesis isomerase [Spirochaetota bacterium]
MQSVPMYQIDAFTNRLFGGNPAAVVPLGFPLGREWLSESRMQQIAAENNLAETAFLIRLDGSYGIRWFTPTTEVDLCGHATLASAFVVARVLEPSAAGKGSEGMQIIFYSPKSGRLPVAVEPGGDLFTLDFPADPVRRVSTPRGLAEALGVDGDEIVETLQGRSDMMCVLSSADRVAAVAPQFSSLADLPARGLIVTAASEQAGQSTVAQDHPEVDFVSRFFAPQVGIPEDPVTGSAHTALAPYWAERLSRRTLNARQVSARGGSLTCRLAGDRVHIGGGARLYLRGEIHLD